MMTSRSGRFYRKNEKEVMQELGLKPTKRSGAGWVEKEDGINEKAICQLKSTFKHSITIKQDDLEKLEYHASISHKIPIFAIQFVDMDKIYLMIKPEDIQKLTAGDLNQERKAGRRDRILGDIEKADVEEDLISRSRDTIRSSRRLRNAYMNKNKRKYKK